MITTPIYDQMIAERGGRPPGGLAEEDFSALSLPPAVELPVESAETITEASSLEPAEVSRVVLEQAPPAPVTEDDWTPGTCLDEELCTKQDPCPSCGPEEYEPDPEATQETLAPEKPAQAPGKVDPDETHEMPVPDESRAARKPSEKKVSAPSAPKSRSRVRTAVPTKGKTAL